MLPASLALLLLTPAPQSPAAPAPPVTPTTLPAPVSKWSDTLKGQWNGSIQLPDGTTIAFVLTVTAPDAASIAIPQQGLPDSPLTAVAIDNASMSFKLVIPSAPDAACPVWTLTPEPGSNPLTAKGSMTQSGLTLTSVIKKLAPGEAPARLNRPQTPKPPFPYTTREVSYASADGAAINGTLSLPQGKPPFPCVLFITGSGLQDRDETLFEHKPFAVIADALARAGVASLRVDDRGWNGAKDPSSVNATSETFASDTAAGVDFLAKQPEIDPRRVGLLGHSEGGLIAPAVAADKPASVAFLILMAGPGVPGNEVLERQMSAILHAAGDASTPAQRAANEARHRATLAAVMKNDLEAARKLIREAIVQSATPGEPAPTGKALDTAVDAAMKQLDSPWMRHFLARDPRPALRKTTCPTLVLNGAKDVQVVASQNVPEVAKALLEGGNTDVTVRVFPDLNHLFQPCGPKGTGGVGEYAQIETTIDPEVLKTIVDWLSAIAGG